MRLAFLCACIAASYGSEAAGAWIPNSVAASARTSLPSKSIDIRRGGGGGLRSLESELPPPSSSSENSDPTGPEIREWVATQLADPAPPTTGGNVVAFDDATTMKVSKPTKLGGFDASSFLPPISVLLGAVVTFYLNNAMSLAPVLASSISAIFTSLLLPSKLAIPALCGSFVGMATQNVVPGPLFPASFYLGLATAVILAVLDAGKLLVGLGGRLGFVAQLGCTSVFIMRKFLLRVKHDVSATVFSRYPTMMDVTELFPRAVLFTCAGAVFMNLWKEMLQAKLVSKLKGGEDSSKSSPLFTFLTRLSESPAAVAVTGLLAHLLFGTPADVGAVYCGSFVGMSSPSKVPTLGALLAASTLAAAAQVAMVGVLVGGWGGKLGTAAFIGVVSYRGIINTGK